MHCDWLPRPGSCAPHTHRHLRRVCFASRVQFAGRRESRWVRASGGIEGPLDPSRHARHLCTIPPSESAVPQPYSWGWPARPWTRSDQTDVLRSGEPRPLTWVGILEKTTRMGTERVEIWPKCGIFVFWWCKHDFRIWVSAIGLTVGL